MENSKYTNIHIMGILEEREKCVENVIWLNCGLKMSESGEGNISRYESHSEFPKIYELKETHTKIK